MSTPVVPRRTGGVAIAALVLGLLAFVGALLIGIRWSGLNLFVYGMLPVPVGLAAVIVAIVALATSGRRGGGGVVPAVIGLVLAPLAVVALFVGRYLGSQYFGFPYQGL